MRSYFKACVCAIFLTACLMMTAGSALAAQKAAPGKKGYWVFRTRVINVMPNTDSGQISDLTVSAGVDVEPDRTLEVDFTYMFNPRFGLELILGTTRHDIVGTDDPLLDGVGIGNVGALPPTLTAQFHFLPNSKIRPYIGVGLNYTLFYAASASKDLEALLGPSSLSLTNSIGLAFQAGADIMIGERAFINIDLKRIDMKTTATVETEANEHEVDVNINPLILGVGFGMSF